MKLFSNKTLMILLVLVSGFGYIISCTHDDELIVPIQLTEPRISRGTNAHIPGEMTSGNTNEWKLDKSHSSVLWRTNYVGASGLLTGRFNQFGMHNVTDAEKIKLFRIMASPLKTAHGHFMRTNLLNLILTGMSRSILPIPVSLAVTQVVMYAGIGTVPIVTE